MDNNNIPDIRPNWHEVNYDAKKIAPYTLEDPLTFLDGSKVTDENSWKKRRQEILGFRHSLSDERPVKRP